MLYDLPVGEAAVGGRIPVFGEPLARQEANLTTPRFQDARVLHAAHGDTPGSGDGLGLAVGAVLHPALLEPGEGEAGMRVHVALGLREMLVEGLVDDLERRANAHRRVVGLDHLRVAGVDRHPRPDGRLRQIHRRDVLGHHHREGVRQLSPERSHELLSRGGWRVHRPWSAHQHDRGGEGVGANADNLRAASVRIGQVPVI